MFRSTEAQGTSLHIHTKDASIGNSKVLNHIQNFVATVQGQDILNQHRYFDHDPEVVLKKGLLSPPSLGFILSSFFV